MEGLHSGGEGSYVSLHGPGVPLPNPNLGIPRNPFGSPGVTKNPNLRLSPAHDGDRVTLIEVPHNPGYYIPKYNPPTGGASTPSSHLVRSFLSKIHQLILTYQYLFLTKVE
jgi:hypothetical protein